MIAVVPVCPGFAMPFYPMRPFHGPSIKYVHDLEKLDPRYHWQLKLNGDRASLAVIDRQVFIQNRVGSWFKHALNSNVATIFPFLKGTWLLDGEVFEKDFYPFEVIVEGGKSIARACPSVRASHAKALCSLLTIPWLYGVSEARLIGRVAIPMRSCKPFEGVVGKRLGSPYIPMGGAAMETTQWIKRKWC